MLITDEYRQLQQQLHADRDDYGVASIGYAALIAEFVVENDIHDILDYGCGKGRLGPALAKCLPYEFMMSGQRYDPGVEQFSKRPCAAELVACVDVLEHVERDCLPDVLDDIQSLARTAVFLTINTAPAAKTLADGRNAHITLMSCNAWMLDYLLPRFDALILQVSGPDVVFIGAPR